jgi:hypothetical protein
MKGCGQLQQNIRRYSAASASVRAYRRGALPITRLKAVLKALSDS